VRVFILGGLFGIMKQILELREIISQEALKNYGTAKVN
jgi:hypothetical protein